MISINLLLKIVFIGQVIIYLTGLNCDFLDKFILPILCFIKLIKEEEIMDNVHAGNMGGEIMNNPGANVNVEIMNNPGVNVNGEIKDNPGANVNGEINAPVANVAIVNTNDLHNQEGVNDEHALLQEHNLPRTVEESTIINKYKK